MYQEPAHDPGAVFLMAASRWHRQGAHKHVCCRASMLAHALMSAAVRVALDPSVARQVHRLAGLQKKPSVET
eukprot:1149234-Pelagomonas_calceolata.AAC.4